MSDETPAAAPIPRPMPVSLRDPAARYLHVAQRLRERGGIEWTSEQVATLERKILFVRTQLGLQKPVAPILPTKISEPEGSQSHHYRVLIANEPHTFIFSTVCLGLVSYLGKGEHTETRKKEPPAAVAP